MTIVWICPACQHKNEEEDDKMDHFRCEKCSREVDDIMAIFWERKLMDPDPRHLA